MIKQGDTVGVVALGGNCEKEKVDKAVLNLENLGFKVKLAKNIYDQNKYLAGSDEGKLNELYEFFQDPAIKLILNARGGYGSIRLINKIDYNIIKANPKPFVGFSDITALLLMFYKKCGLVTYHGPMACSDFAKINEFTINNFQNPKNEFILEKVYNSGNASGILWGGNLSTVVSLCGQDFIPDNDFIFFTEDLNEPVYKIDKMLTQLFNIEKFRNNCKAIVLGDFLDVDNKEWLAELFCSFNLPTAYIKGITHSKEKITLPIGKLARLEDDILKIN